MKTPRSRGFSLIEFLIAITVLGILASLAMPGFGRWIASTQVRTMAESIQNGLRLAQAEAALTNGTVTFTFTSDAAPSCTSTAATVLTAWDVTNWVVCADSRLRSQNVGASGSKTATVTSNFSTISFTGMGRATLGTPGQVDIESASGSCETATAEGIRCLRVVVSSGGKVRMCDPLLPAGDSASCTL